MLGFNFQPQIRNIKTSQLFSIKSSSEYPNLLEEISGKVIEDKYAEIKRLVYFVQKGKVSSSLILGELGSYLRQNPLSFAHRELRRIENIIFMVDYITDEYLRRKITSGLNKTEAINV